MPPVKFVELSRCGKGNEVALLTLRRPEKANAYHTPMLREMGGVLDDVADDAGVKAVVLTGAGEHFCAGADLDELKQRQAEDAFNLFSRALFDRIAHFPIPTLAAIQGAAIAGGCELALACDLRVCSPSARFGLPELKLGLIPAAGGIKRLVDLVGVARTKDIILFGRELDAERALAWGIVSDIESDCVAKAVSLAEVVAAHDPLAFRVAKGAIGAMDPCEGHGLLEALGQGLLYERRSRGG